MGNAQLAIGPCPLLDGPAISLGVDHVFPSSKPAREHNMLIWLRFGRALGPDRHQRPIRSIKDQEMLVSRVPNLIASDFWNKHHVVRFGHPQFARYPFPQFLG